MPCAGRPRYRWFALWGSYWNSLPHPAKASCSRHFSGTTRWASRPSYVAGRTSALSTELVDNMAALLLVHPTSIRGFSNCRSQAPFYCGLIFSSKCAATFALCRVNSLRRESVEALRCIAILAVCEVLADFAFMICVLICFFATFGKLIGLFVSGMIACMASVPTPSLEAVNGI